MRTSFVDISQSTQHNTTKSTCVMKRPWSKRDGHRKTPPAPPPSSSTFEAALEEQRRKHKEAEASTDGSKQQPAIAIPGFVYDSSTDRYFRASSSSSSSSSQSLAASGSCPSPSSWNNPVHVPHTNNLISILSDRAISSHHHQRANQLYVRKQASLLSLQVSFTSEKGTSRFDTDVHPIFGIVQVVSNQPVITSHPLPRISSSKSIDYGYNSHISMTRITQHNLTSHGMYGYSSPSWRPYVSDSVQDQRQLFAIIGHSSQHAHTETLLVHKGTASLGGGALRVLTKLRVKDTIHKVRWDDDGMTIYHLGEKGIYQSPIETASSSSSSSSSTSSSSSARPTTLTLIQTKHTIASTLCNALSSIDSSVLFVGYRNGTIASIDTRSKQSNHERGGDHIIGVLPFRVGHLACLRDEITLIGQDITGELCLFDRRMYNGRNVTANSVTPPSSKTSNGSHFNKTSKHVTNQQQQERPFGGEYLRITSGQPNEIHTRNFWITPDESTIIAPYQHIATISGGNNKTGGNPETKNTLDFSNKSGLALWNLTHHKGSSNIGQQSPSSNPQLLSFSLIPHTIRNNTLDDHGNITICPNHQWSKYYQQHSGTTSNVMNIYHGLVATASYSSQHAVMIGVINTD